MLLSATFNRLIAAGLLLLAICQFTPAKNSGLQEARFKGAISCLIGKYEKAGETAALDLARSQGVAIRKSGRNSLVPLIVRFKDGIGSGEFDRTWCNERGMTVEAVSRSYARVLVPMAQARTLARHPQIREISLPFRAVELSPGMGSRVSESVALTNAAALQAGGVTGSGVKVAVVDLGFINLTNAISQGELPAGTVRVTLPGGTGTIEEVTSHGTAVAEQLMDMAPGVTLYCIKVAADPVDMQNAADTIKARGIRIANHSIGWVNTSYYDDTGPIDSVVNASYDNDNVFWTVAAGNEATRHWRGAWNDPDANNILNFTASSERMNLTSADDTTAEVYLNWNQYDSARTDLDLYVYDKNSSLVAKSDQRQDTVFWPTEYVSFTYSPSMAPYQIEVRRKYGPTTGLDISIFSPMNDLEYAIPRASLMDPATAHGAFTVAAVSQTQWNFSSPAIEPYSSRGPTVDGRMKPDITAADSTTSYTYGTSGAWGTSFSAPAVAGAAALILQQHSTLSAAALADTLRALARDAGPAGTDSAFGAGLLYCQPTVAFSSSAQTVNENVGTVTVTAVMVSKSNRAVTVPYTVSGTATNPADHNLSSGTITIPAGSTSGSVSFTVVDDALYEGNETVILTMGTPTNATAGSTTVHTVTITDNDPAPTVFWSAASQGVNEAIGTVTVTATLSAASGLIVSVPYTVSGTATNPADHNLSSGTITIPAGSTSGSVSFNVVDDTIPESDETVVLTMGTPTNATVGSPSVHTVTIADNDGRPAPTSPADGATGISLAPTLTWTAVTGAVSYRVQLSTSSSFGATVVDDSTVTVTSKSVSGLSMNTTYYWRVNAKKTGGTSAWSATWSFTTIPPAPTPPTLISPASGSTDVAMAPTLSWSSVSGAATYHLQVSTSSVFSPLFFEDSTLTSASKALSGLANSTVYYWRVSAKNMGGTSAWSAAWSFTTIITAPGVPALTSPANAATGVSVAPTLSWSSATGAATYHVQVSTGSAFATLVTEDSTVTGTSKALSGLANSTGYFWRVSAKNAGGTSAWSATWSFTTIIATPAAPVLLSPANGAVNVALMPTLAWNAVSGAATYRLQVSTSAAFGTVVLDDSTLAGTSRALTTPLAGGTACYWRVNAKNAGGSGAWSAVWSFSTLPPLPAAVILVSPRDTLTLSVDSVRFVWNKSSPSVDKYDLEITLDSGMTSFYSADSAVLDTFRVRNGLTDNTTFWWRVRAHNAGGWGSYSAKRKFAIRKNTTGVIPRIYGITLSGFAAQGPAIRFGLPVASLVSLTVYTIQGKAVRVLCKERMAAGCYRIPLSSIGLGRGYYILSFIAGNFSARRMVCFF